MVRTEGSRQARVDAEGSALCRKYAVPQCAARGLGPLTLLRALRQGRGLTVEQVAVELLCSPSKVSRMETGQRGATPRDVRDLCAIYGVSDQAEADHLMGLARRGKEQGWWQSYDLDPTFSPYIGLEAEAKSTKYYQSTIIPGLLQTAAGAAATPNRDVPAAARNNSGNCILSRCDFLYLDRAGDVRRYEEVFDQLGQIALTPRESVDLITAISNSY